ncbi:hypothetical protein DPEC_G00109110 [Dallia pectoralis]|uniref:Uncharacterized protein n=1 Tax=Dallia pectoralis TaxID=75939 RepID=A0ACC2GSM2_DALPE|nr:hypothetical protein DPEC_G00109110 [Dallia pectoralis]
MLSGPTPRTSREQAMRIMCLAPAAASTMARSGHSAPVAGSHGLDSASRIVTTEDAIAEEACLAPWNMRTNGAQRAPWPNEIRRAPGLCLLSLLFSVNLWGSFFSGL